MVAPRYMKHNFPAKPPACPARSSTLEGGIHERVAALRTKPQQISTKTRAARFKAAKHGHVGVDRFVRPRPTKEALVLNALKAQNEAIFQEALSV